METLFIWDAIWNVITNNVWIVVELWRSEKRTCPNRFHRKIHHEGVYEMNNKFNQKRSTFDHPV